MSKEVQTAQAKEVAVIPAKKSKEVVLQGTVDKFDFEKAENFLEIMEEIKYKKIANMEVASIDMVTKYLKFTELQNKPIKRFFIGWTARPLVDYKTKEPLYDESTREQMYGLAVIFYNEEAERMEVNMAFQLVKTIRDLQMTSEENEPILKKGGAIEITYKGLETTTTGNNQQQFSIKLLK